MMDAFLELFGSYTIFGLSIYKWFLIGGATIFIYKTVIRKVYRKIKSAYELYEEKEKMLQKALEQIDRYPEWRQQSIDIRSELSESIRKLENKIDWMKGSIGDLKKSSSEGMAYTWRYRILRFDDEIRHDEKHTKEHFDQLMDDITKYELYCASHPDFPNNKAVFAIKNIKRVYQKCTDERNFL